MSKLLLLMSILIATGCASTTENEVAKTSETHCEKLSSVVSGAVAMKWASRQSSENSTAKEKALMDWRFLAVVNEMSYDMLSFKYYTQEKCEMSQKGLTAKSIEVLKPSIQKCWYSSQTMDSEQCVSKIVSVK